MRNRVNNRIRLVYLWRRDDPVFAMHPERDAFDALERFLSFIHRLLLNALSLKPHYSRLSPKRKLNTAIRQIFIQDEKVI